MSDSKRPSEGSPTVPLLEERASIDKRTVTTGKVRVVTHTETVDELAWIHGWPKDGPLRSGTLAADQINHHLWPGQTAGRRHAGWKRVRRQALSARKGRRRFARDDRLTGFAARRAE
jgi:hypothetical protein